MMPRPQVVKSIFKRNFYSYFSGVLGYLFIFAFVVVGGRLAFGEEFFTANEPNLDQLSKWFPTLLLFFVPAITMGVWAEEQKMGTDELLFTMPATDLEILLGKYKAVVGVYAVALVFSMAHIFVLMSLGNPDPGLIATTYFGYFIAGAALISAGMLASIVTSNMAVAFVLGVLFCLVPVYISIVGSTVGLGDALDGFSVQEQFRDFSVGVVTISGLLYFVSFTVLMLYLNLILISRRHWSGDSESHMGLQYTARTISIGVILACLTAWAGYSAMRVDATSERLFSLSKATRMVLKELDSDRPIEIQAFISPEVPSEYIDTRKQLIGMLRQFDDIGGKNLEVRYVDIEPFSQEADEAEHFGIDAVGVMSERSGRRSVEEIYLGAVVISSYDKVVIPFFGKGLPIEYELTRSIQTVADEGRYTVGVLQTDANVISGTGGWQIVEELRKQYDVEQVSPDSAIDSEKFDVLLAVMPSSLTQPQMENLVGYAQTGSPLLVFDDPFPLTLGGGMGVTSAPRQQKSRPNPGMMGMQQPPPEQKADGGRATSLLSVLGIEWPYDNCVFAENNPHPEFANLPSEYVFVTRSSDDDDQSFNPSSAISRGLEELIVLYAGEVSKRSGAEVEFTPLLQTIVESGVMSWEEFVDESGFNFMAMQQTAQPRQRPLRRPDGQTHTLAAHIKSDSKDKPVNAIFVTDVDMISDFFFQERNMGNLSMKFDNVTFVLNAVDSLAGDDSFIELRSRRTERRSLTRIEAQKRTFFEAAREKERAADDEADEELDERREQLKKAVEEIQNDENLDPVAKAQRLQQAQEMEQQRMSLAEAKIEQNKEREIERIRNSTKQRERILEWWTSAWATWLPPIPPLFVGFFVFLRRLQDEKSTITESRRRS